MAARLILNLDFFSSISLAFRFLHWLPIKERINFKILLLTYKALIGLAPSYLYEMLSLRPNHYSLRSSNSCILYVPRTRCKTLGDRSFSASAPKLWNALPSYIKESNTVATFKSRLKTHIFNRLYN